MCDDFIELSDDDYDLQYEDSASEPDVDLENQYYQSKILKEDDSIEALNSFLQVIQLQGDTKTVWGFKSLKQMIKINFALGHHDQMLDHYEDMLTYIRTTVTKNQAEKSINSILDYTSTSNNHELLSRIYKRTLEVLRDAKNHRLWFKTHTKLGKVYLDCGQYNKVSSIITELKTACIPPNETDPLLDPQTNAQLLEIYALEIQLYSSTRNNQKQLREIYQRALQIQAYSIPHPVVMGAIRECGGHMHLATGQYEAAYTAFFDAFKNHDETGNGERRIACLKCLILTSMLMESDIDPMDSQEAKPYKDDEEIVGVRELLRAFQDTNAKRFEEVYKLYHSTFTHDPFIRKHIDGLFETVRAKVLVQIVQPYTRIGLAFIAKELNIDALTAEFLLIKCILNGEIVGRFDQIGNVLIMENVNKEENARNRALTGLIEKIEKLHLTICHDRTVVDSC